MKNSGYLGFRFEGKDYRTHRVVWEIHNGKIPKDKVIDHINANKVDNRIENLQLVTAQENSLRRTNYKGYHERDGKYEVKKVIDKIAYHIGVYGTPCGAYMANRTFKYKGGV